MLELLGLPELQELLQALRPLEQLRLLELRLPQVLLQQQVLRQQLELLRLPRLPGLLSLSLPPRASRQMLGKLLLQDSMMPRQQALPRQRELQLILPAWQLLLQLEEVLRQVLRRLLERVGQRISQEQERQLYQASVQEMGLDPAWLQAVLQLQPLQGQDELWLVAPEHHGLQPSPWLLVAWLDKKR